jgi:hypothetical protein
MTLKLSDLLAVSLILIALWIINFIIGNQSQILNIFGIIGGVIIIVVEGVFLWNLWSK